MSRTTAGERMQRMLALVPWVAGHHGPTVDEVCARFQLRPKELTDELQLLTLVGVPPHTPDQLFEAVIEDGRVFVHLAPTFDRALRLTPEQALTLVAAGASLAAVPGNDPEGPLARGVAKLASALGIDPAAALTIELGAAAPGVLEALRGAQARRRRVRFGYYTAGRDAHATRQVDPYRVWSAEGQWYLAGFDHDREARRTFRVDRISDLEVLADGFDPVDDDPANDPLFRSEGSPSVVIDVAPEAAWVAEAYPLEDYEELPDGTLRLTLAVGGRPWLERLLLTLGPTARVHRSDDDPALAAAGRDAAARVLERYR